MGGGGAAALTEVAYRIPKTNDEMRAKNAGTSNGNDARVSARKICEQARLRTSPRTSYSSRRRQ